MNKEAILKHTASYKEDVLERLQDPEFARIYLETAFEFYQEDGDTDALLLAMRDVAEAQGGIGKLAKKTAISREHLYDILASKHNPLVFVFAWNSRKPLLNTSLLIRTN
jgi:DNA-binding phage protein